MSEVGGQIISGKFSILEEGDNSAKNAGILPEFPKATTKTTYSEERCTAYFRAHQ